MWLLFVPLAILFAVLLSVGLVVAGVISVLGWGWPWLLIALGVWLFIHEDGRHRRARQWKAASGPITVRGWSKDKRQSSRSATSGVFGSSASATASKPSAGARKPDLPVDVQMKVEQIRRKAETLEGHADQFPPFSQDLYLVRQTRSDYLPRTLDTYLAMPADAVDRPMVPGGKTPHQELRAQLDLLDTKLDEIARDVERQNNERLMANRKFLQDRFDLRNDAEPKEFKAESA